MRARCEERKRPRWRKRRKRRARKRCWTRTLICWIRMMRRAHKETAVSAETVQIIFVPTEGIAVHGEHQTVGLIVVSGCFQLIGHPVVDIVEIMHKITAMIKLAEHFTAFMPHAIIRQRIYRLLRLRNRQAQKTSQEKDAFLHTQSTTDKKILRHNKSAVKVQHFYDTSGILF